jgi:hypothetical protein
MTSQPFPYWHCVARGLVIALLGLGTLASPVAAEERARTWLGLGFGAGGRDDGEGLVLTGALVRQQREHYFAIRALALADPFGALSESSSEIALLYGRAVTRRYGHAALATGLAATFRDPCGAARERHCATIGIPVVAEAAVQPLPILGLGVQVFANFNRNGSYAGATAFLQVGWMPRD